MSRKPDVDKGKAPAFQFYPGDWLSKIKLRSCTLEARGLMIDLMCLMHQSDKYGCLLINGLMPEDKDISRLLGIHHKTYYKTLKELLLNGVLKKDEEGVIYCERMEKDERIRQLRRDSGSKGGNPLLKQKDYREDNQNITPSSSSSSSPSSSKKNKNTFAADDKRPSSDSTKIFYDFKTHSWKNVEGHIERWKGVYPAIDISFELGRAGEWLESNPKNRKSNYQKFLTNWFTKAQDRAPAKGSEDGIEAELKRRGLA